NRNCNVAAAGAVFTIAKASAEVAAAAKTKRYGEEDPELTATVTGVIGGDELAYTLARAPGENAGEYVITVSPGMNRNYNVAAAGAVFTITKADTAVVTPPSAKNLIETGSPQELVTAGTAEGGEMCYALGEDLPSAWSTYIPTATVAGTYIVWYKAAGDEDHLDSIQQKLNAEIIAAPDFGPVKLIVSAGAIGKSAFQGDGNVTIVDASRCEEIGANAFGSSGISQIRLPKGCAIDETAFMNCGTVFVFAPAGGRTETDCRKIKNCMFVKEEPTENVEGTLANSK
ncbi:MAG: hypothetical protein K6F13_07230, partial [Lachnospiraceae bacterium]|nr:hypothetical protein [Lachnospiraceae bacterium]